MIGRLKVKAQGANLQAREPPSTSFDTTLQHDTLLHVAQRFQAFQRGIIHFGSLSGRLARYLLEPLSQIGLQAAGFRRVTLKLEDVPPLSGIGLKIVKLTLTRR